MEKENQPVICVIGTTGSGKSTFCHCLTGSDPRITNDKFFVMDSEIPVTK